MVATTDASEPLDACVSALRAATAATSAEIVVVDAGPDRAIDAMGARRISAPPGTLVPRLWLRGLHACHGRYVAFTIAQCVVSPGWANAMIAGMTGDVGGAGGAFALAPRTGPCTWALYFLRYSNFVEERWTPGPVAGDIAGDNALYRRSDLLAAGVCPPDGFWEVEVHRQLRRQGRTLVAVPNAAATLVGGHTPRRIIRERFRHGRHFGAWRATTAVRRGRTVAAAPLVPMVLVVRICRRIWPFASHRLRFVAALPWLLVFATSWAIGETVGALCGAAGSDA